MQMAAWMNKTFKVSASTMTSFEKFAMSLEIQTKAKTKSKQEYKVRKKTKARTITVELTLHAFLGVDVESEILSWMQLAHAGKGGRFYIGGRSMTPSTLILTAVKPTDVTFLPNTHMESAKLALTFEQASKTDKKGTTRNVTGATYLITKNAKMNSKALKKI